MSEKLEKPKFSIIIPIYNPDLFSFLGCLESCKSQTYDNFEVICMYDGDNCDTHVSELIENYSEFKLLGKDHTGRADTLNLGFASSKGEYVVLLNQHSILNRDALSYLDKTIQDEDVLYESDHDVELNSIYNINISCIKRSSLRKNRYFFEQYYFPYDHEKFLFNSIRNELKIKRIPSIYAKLSKEHKNKSEKIENILYNLNNQESNKELSVIIPFKNEKTEVERTIYSIYATSKKCEIILINDCSDDDYDYSYIENLFPNIKYIVNKISIGHGNIDLGVVNSDCDYCMLMDAHMRFFENDWDSRIINALKTHEKSIIYCNTTIMHVRENGTYDNEDNINKTVKNCGAKILLDINNKDKQGLFFHKWCSKNSFDDKDEIIHKSPNILGACYCFSKDWYHYIGGTYGLAQYGLSEAALTIKTWLMGGEVYRIQDLYVGHIYRKKFPYSLSGYTSYLNDRFLIELNVVNKELKNQFLEYSNKRLDEKYRKYFNKLWDKVEPKFVKYCKHYQSKFVHDIEWFRDNINNKFD